MEPRTGATAAPLATGTRCASWLLSAATAAPCGRLLAMNSVAAITTVAMPASAAMPSRRAW